MLKRKLMFLKSEIHQKVVKVIITEVPVAVIILRINTSLITMDAVQEVVFLHRVKVIPHQIKVNLILIDQVVHMVIVVVAVIIRIIMVHLLRVNMEVQVPVLVIIRIITRMDQVNIVRRVRHTRRKRVNVIVTMVVKMNRRNRNVMFLRVMKIVTMKFQKL